MTNKELSERDEEFLWAIQGLPEYKKNTIIVYMKDKCEANRNLKPSDNNDFKKVCSKCGVELSQYTIEKNICNRCSVGMPIIKR